jgi:hypothetical protein
MSAGSSMPAGGQLVVSTRIKDFESRAVAPPGVDPGAYAVVSITAIGWGIADSTADGGTATAAIAQTVSRSGARLATYVSPGQSLEFAVYLALAAEVVEV